MSKQFHEVENTKQALTSLTTMSFNLESQLETLNSSDMKDRRVLNNLKTSLDILNDRICTLVSMIAKQIKQKEVK